MSQYFETIKYSNGEFFLLDYHDRRLNKTRRDIFGSKKDLNLRDFLINPPSISGLFKCRVVYDSEIRNIEYLPYELSLHREIALFDCLDFEYAYKAIDRDYILNAVKNSETNDVIFIKDEKIHDASYSNLAFYDGGHWLTPKTVLLNGIKRQFLLEKGLLEEREIKVNDLGNFEKISFINAIRDFELVYEFESIDDKLYLTLME